MAFPRILQRLFVNSGAGPKLRHDIIPWDEEKSLVALEAWRQAMIGTSMPMTSTTLPAGFMWADGSFAAFAAYPELKAKYDAGGFAGMLLAYNASEADIAAYPGKFKPDAANPTGLFLPRLEGLFARYCARTGAGAYQADAVQTGITGFSAEPMGGSDVQYDVVTAYGNVTKSSNYSDSVFIPLTEMGITVPHYAFYTAQRTADKTRPENVALPIALYLGRPAEI